MPRRSPKLAIVGQADHASTDELGGKRAPRPSLCSWCGSPRPRAARYCSVTCETDAKSTDVQVVVNGQPWQISSEHVTWTREDCVRGTPQTGSLEDRRFRGRICSAARCRHHLLITDKNDMAGRPHGGRRAPGRPRDVWTDNAAPPQGSCALDVVDVLGPQSCAEIAPRLAVTRRAVELVAARAVAKLRANGADETVVRAMEAMLEAERRGSPLAEAQDDSLGKRW